MQWKISAEHIRELFIRSTCSFVSWYEFIQVYHTLLNTACEFHPRSTHLTIDCLPVTVWFAAGVSFGFICYNSLLCHLEEIWFILVSFSSGKSERISCWQNIPAIQNPIFEHVGMSCSDYALVLYIQYNETRYRYKWVIYIEGTPKLLFWAGYPRQCGTYETLWVNLPRASNFPSQHWYTQQSCHLCTYSTGVECFSAAKSFHPLYQLDVGRRAILSQLGMIGIW